MASFVSQITNVPATTQTAITPVIASGKALIISKISDDNATGNSTFDINSTNISAALSNAILYQDETGPYRILVPGMIIRFGQTLNVTIDSGTHNVLVCGQLVDDI